MYQRAGSAYMVLLDFAFYLLFCAAFQRQVWSSVSKFKLQSVELWGNFETLTFFLYEAEILRVHSSSKSVNCCMPHVG